MEIGQDILSIVGIADAIRWMNRQGPCRQAQLHGHTSKHRQLVEADTVNSTSRSLTMRSVRTGILG